MKFLFFCWRVIGLILWYIIKFGSRRYIWVDGHVLSGDVSTGGGFFGDFGHGRGNSGVSGIGVGYVLW